MSEQITLVLLESLFLYQNQKSIRLQSGKSDIVTHFLLYGTQMYSKWQQQKTEFMARSLPLLAIEFESNFIATDRI